MSDRPTLTWSLKEAKDWLRARVDPGEVCPCCNQKAKVYPRTVHHTLAVALIQLYRRGLTYMPNAPTPFVHAPSLPGDTHEISQLVWWGLIEEEKGKRPDGGRKGFWRITQAGIDFVEGKRTIQKTARVYDAQVVSYRGKQVTIKDCLDDPFDYDRLMSS